MSERYIDPNSGAAPQPGGLAAAPVADAKDSEKDAGNVTLPEDANPAPDGQEQGDVTEQVAEPVSDEQLRGGTYDTALQNQAAPLGSQPGAEDRSDDAGMAGDNEAETEGSTEATTEGSTEEAGQADDGADAGSKDYSELLDQGLEDVQKYMDENPDEKAAVQEAEAQRDKPRKGVVNY